MSAVSGSQGAPVIEARYNMLSHNGGPRSTFQKQVGESVKVHCYTYHKNILTVPECKGRALWPLDMVPCLLPRLTCRDTAGDHSAVRVRLSRKHTGAMLTKRQVSSAACLLTTENFEASSQ